MTAVARGPGPGDRDSIRLTGLRVLGRHGALPGERDRPQPFEVDLEIHTDLRRAGSTDHLPDTLDYGVLAQMAARVVTDERHALLERIAERIAEELTGDPRVASVVVTVRKLRPPVPVDLRSAGVCITRP